MENLWGKLKEPSRPVMPPSEEMVTKALVRQRIWEFLERKDIAQFPRPVYHRIPNFRGSASAGMNLAALPEFEAARTILVSPDKPQEEVRYQTLARQKCLLVPSPRLKGGGLFNRLVSAPGGSSEDLRRMVTAQGIESDGKPVPIAARIKIDLVVVGAVAVDRLGRRVGKGEGFSDLEFAMAATNHGGAVGADTLVVASVHDAQVFDRLPEHLFGEQDVPVDIICTPTEIIRVQNRLRKPSRIVWSLISREKFAQIEILKEIQFKESRAGRDVRLKEDILESSGRSGGAAAMDGQYEELRVTVGGGKKGAGGRRKVAQGLTNGSGLEDAVEKSGSRQKIGRAKIAATEKASEAAVSASTPNRQDASNNHVQSKSSSNHKSKDQQQQQSRGGGAKPNANSSSVLTIFIGRIPGQSRIKELKEVLDGHGVNLTSGGIDLVWKGQKGFAFVNIDQERCDLDHDEVLQRMQGIKLRDVLLNVQGDKRRRKTGASLKNGPANSEANGGAADAVKKEEGKFEASTSINGGSQLCESHDNENKGLAPEKIDESGKEKDDKVAWENHASLTDSTMDESKTMNNVEGTSDKQNEAFCIKGSSPGDEENLKSEKDLGLNDKTTTLLESHKSNVDSSDNDEVVSKALEVPGSISSAKVSKKSEEDLADAKTVSIENNIKSTDSLDDASKSPLHEMCKVAESNTTVNGKAVAAEGKHCNLVLGETPGKENVADIMSSKLDDVKDANYGEKKDDLLNGC